MANDAGRDRDLVLAPGEFAFVQDTTKGIVNVNVGPYKTSMAGTDQPVVWDREKLRFVRTELEPSIQRNRVAPEGFYLVLYNPASEESKDQPREGSSSNQAPLNVGHRVNIPGPVNRPLWPGQMADVIRGHHIRSNQYLLAQVYNDVEASKNWHAAVVKPAAVADSGTPPATPPTPEAAAPAVPPVQPARFTPGQLMIIKGTDVSFFIPPTGIKVVPESEGQFVREAVTLERLEYCILLDEDGNKRFVQGPDVVFPEPTEQFVVKDNLRKFKAIELNETTGIYVKVIADYEDATGKHKAGDELFITGKEQAIYFQREEHSVIRYGEQTKHYAVAVPAGEGRYVLNRITGVITLVKGPRMLLCDPRTEVIVRRVLSQGTAALWYPNNSRVLQVNRELEEAMGKTVDSASQYTASLTGPTLSSERGLQALNYVEETARASRQLAGDTFARGTKFTPPRTITLDTKYEGAVSVVVWTGYAVWVIPKTGERKVVVGPANVLLEYDETLAPLELSTGRPKSDGKLFRTAYLRVHNNKVSDLVAIETKDLVRVNMTLSYRVNFEGEDQTKWFAVENYVRLLTDHLRSKIRNAAKQVGIEEFYSNPISIVRDTVLGSVATGATGPANAKRPGLTFEENNMRVYDVEVLEVKIDDPNVAGLLNAAQLLALKSAIQISQEEQQLATTLRSEELKRKTATALAETIVKNSEETKRELTAHLEVAVARVKSETEAERTRLIEQQGQSEVRSELNDADLSRKKAQDDARLAVRGAEIKLELSRILGESEEIVKRANSVSPALAAALSTFSDQALVEKISTSLAPMAAMSGFSAADILAKLFHGTPFEQVMSALGTRTRPQIGVAVPEKKD
jgi:major vault protein